MNKLMRRYAYLTLVSLLLILFIPNLVSAQGLDRFDRDNARAMLTAMKDDLKKNYYDPTLKGVNLDERFKQAEEQIKNATTRDQLMVIVAQTMLDFNDSHTFFVPPARAAKIQYGWEMRMIGEAAFVTAVKPKSDAEAKGLKPGDEVLAVDGYRPTRDNMWKMSYRYYTLMPARGMKLVVKSPADSQPRDIEVLAKIERSANVTDWEKIFARALREEWDIYHDRGVEVGNKDAFVWQMPTFAVAESHIDAIMGRARSFKALVIDLRGNGGGYVKALERLTGYFFDKDMKIADVKGRKEEKPSIAKTRGGDIFKGQLVVLIDSESLSASEAFARVIQLEKRGTVVGDRSGGAVMQSKYFDHQSGVGSVLYYGASITVSDLIMSDGKSLEKVGVTPDETKLPSGADLAAQSDPVLAYALSLVGVTMDPEKAGSLFPKEWR